MSFGPWTAMGASMNGVGAAPKVGYMNRSDRATPLCHVGIFSKACSVCCLSLLNSLYTQRGTPLTDRLEWHGGLFLDSSSTLFVGGGRSRSRELPEDSSSSAATLLLSSRIGFLPLFCFTRGTRWLLPRAFSTRSLSRLARKRSFSYCRWSARLCNSAIFPACSSYLVSIS